MTAISTSILIFFIVFGGALLGMLLNRLLPQHHLADQSKDVVKLGMGLLVTMAGMVLGLQLSSAKTTYDTQSSELPSSRPGSSCSTTPSPISDPRPTTCATTCAALSSG